MGGCTRSIQFYHSLKAPGFTPCTYNVKNCYQDLLSKAGKLYSYATVCCRYYLERLHQQPWIRNDHSALFVVQMADLFSKLRGGDDGHQGRKIVTIAPTTNGDGGNDNGATTAAAETTAACNGDAAAIQPSLLRKNAGTGGHIPAPVPVSAPGAAQGSGPKGGPGVQDFVRTTRKYWAGLELLVQGLFTTLFCSQSTNTRKPECFMNQ